MNITNHGDHSVAFQVTNDLGEVTSELDTPGDITAEITRAMKRRQRSGVVYGHGQRWSWHASDQESTVSIQFTRGGEVESEIEVPESGWAAFCRLAQRRDVEPKEWLATLMAIGISDNIDPVVMCQWMFRGIQGPTSEIQRFEAAQREFRSAEVSAPAFTTHRVE
jgi:hypothetical protein